MARVRIVLNPQAVKRLLTTEALDDLEPRARRIAARAGEGHRIETDVTSQRARVVVVTDTYEARRREATDRTLSRALEAGRG